MRRPTARNRMLFAQLIIPLSLAMLFSAFISLAYMYFHAHVMFVFIGIRLLLPNHILSHRLRR